MELLDGKVKRSVILTFHNGAVAVLLITDEGNHFGQENRKAIESDFCRDSSRRWKRVKMRNLKQLLYELEEEIGLHSGSRVVV